MAKVLRVALLLHQVGSGYPLALLALPARFLDILLEMNLDHIEGSVLFQEVPQLVS